MGLHGGGEAVCRRRGPRGVPLGLTNRHSWFDGPRLTRLGDDADILDALCALQAFTNQPGDVKWM